jgi:hypothetical protein
MPTVTSIGLASSNGGIFKTPSFNYVMIIDPTAQDRGRSLARFSGLMTNGENFNMNPIGNMDMLS